jgi:hypothetical protein
MSYLKVIVTTQVSIHKFKNLERKLYSYDMIYLSTAIGFTSDGSSTVHIYTQTIHITTQITTEQHKITTNLEECRPCPVFASFTLAFALQLRKKHGKTSVMYVVIYFTLDRHVQNLLQFNKLLTIV